MGNGESAPITAKQLENDIKISWKSSKKCPFEPREGQCCAAVGNSLYIFGGVVCTFSKDDSERNIVTNYETNDLLKFDCDKNNWELVNACGDVPEGRSGSTLSAVGDKLYLFGGLSENQGWVDDFYEFDIKTEKWTKLEHISGECPSPRDKLSSATKGTDVYYFGGFGPQLTPEPLTTIAEDDSDEEYEDVEIQDIEQEQEAANFTWFNDLHKYDTLSKTWSVIKPKDTIPTPRAAHTLCTLNNEQLLLFGGRDVTGRTNDVWFFDPRTAYWTQANPKGAKPNARSFHAALCVGNRMVVLGGRGVTNEHFQDIHIYDSVQNHWLQPNIDSDLKPPAVGMHSFAVVGDNAVLTFGASDIDPVTNSCMSYYQDTFAVSATDIVTGSAKILQDQVEEIDKEKMEQNSESDAIPGFLGLQRTEKKSENGLQQSH